MFDVKVGDQLISLVDRPKLAGVSKGETVIITRIEQGGNICFRNFHNHHVNGDWVGNINDGWWELVVVDLENK